MSQASRGPGGAARGGLVFLHAGAFSGSATGLLAALRADSSVPGVVACDLMPLAREPRLAAARLRATAEARRAGPGTPWAKTAAWPTGIQRYVTRRGLFDGDRPVLIVQSLPALVPPGDVRYAVYTDRVGLEGTTGAADTPGGTGAYRSRYTEGWLDRERRMLAGAHRVFVMGQSTADVLADRYGIPADRIAVVGAGVNVPAPDTDPDLQPLSPRDPAAPPRLLFVGTQWELKGGPELLQAFARLHADDARWNLVLAGSAPDGRLPAGVTSAGRVPHRDMPGLYAGVDALVIPTHREAYGIALVEALTRGLPCVGTDVGNQRSIVEDAGLLVPPGDADALYDALRTLHTDYSDLRAKAGKRGAVLRPAMTWPHVARTIWEALQ
ncbi:glycosyltransferase family 4 protein [Yinghuangia soli]|uniref:Glycosyltransferase family 4 protein n=1 Tax=Yinghuangia soli TaxID=2908204 RepID=A0AA41Q428_9ACTN|nr:glycosyltransferase family 4 protein [Yinghuangia soli]MCF2529737.1 glycosyltransferase family 4 protein [Yinghuangia soli]